MPKREKSPETVPDSKFLAIYKPYPANADMELVEDQIKLTRWIASIVPNQFLIALHYKPKARGIVIIEISIECQEIGVLLLGEHRWSEFLRKPKEEELEGTSQVFYSIYSTLREVRKDGWKQILVRGDWFKEGEFRPINPIIVHPYPPTHWCPPLQEDKTNKPICRPLPVQKKPPPPAPLRQVVGSSSWLGAKQAPSTNTPIALESAWDMYTKSQPVVTPNSWNKPIINAKPADDDAQQQKNAAARRRFLWSNNAAPKASNIVPTDSVDALANALDSVAVSANQATAIEDALFGDDDDAGDDMPVGNWSVTEEEPSSPAQDYSASVDETLVEDPEKFYCPIHLHRCHQGICIEGAKARREQKKREQEAERLPAKQKKSNRDRGRSPREEDGLSSGLHTASQVRQISTGGSTNANEAGVDEVDEQRVVPKPPAKAPAKKPKGRGRGTVPKDANGGGGAGGENGNAWAQPGAKSDWAAQGRKPRR
ncbi:hypothetical protein BD626DRAFT_579596 [Schizophyllum amplum]|uniref:Uncharacterized protein n=1 Tax=Schizophyllum amplum TaxID=97359 RepID=A0A550CVJ8_9AGAR|nr:hypothetical protein BD626DRAFT_579596 [Auriculariopsis ampla]